MKRTLAVLGLICSILLFVKYTVKEIKEIQAIQIDPVDIQKEVDKTSSEKPKLLSHKLPDYPTRALDAKLESDVEVVFDVDENGIVQNIRVFEPVHVGFHRSIRRAMREWRYETGKPTKDLKIIIEFRLENEKSSY
ncbi:TonB family protein [Proteus terrae]|jgi:periplasmic protein TonB|uniref:TonB family protein n=1 Tax=Proteus terrae TaxID=1574161 RepID=UPI00298D1280|nr:TonB family protein [Proteus terrae]WPC98552.1 TonB family protein [Proteus terrae]